MLRRRFYLAWRIYEPSAGDSPSPIPRRFYSKVDFLLGSGQTTAPPEYATDHTSLVV